MTMPVPRRLGEGGLVGGIRGSRAQIIDLFVAQAVPLTASLATTLITARLLGPHGRGDLALVIGTANIIGALCYCSVHIGTARAVMDGDTGARGRIEHSAVALAGVGVLSALVVGCLVPSVSSVGAFNGVTLAFAVGGGALVAVNLVVLRTAQALGESRVFRNGWLCQTLVFPIIGIPVAATTRQPLAVATCWMLAVVLSSILARVQSRAPLA